MAAVSSEDEFRLIRDEDGAYHIEKDSTTIFLLRCELELLVHRAMDFVLDADDWGDAHDGGAS